MRHTPPHETRPARMHALSVLPVFLDLRDRRAVVAGSGEALVWKAELLAAAGAHVIIFAPQPCPDLFALAATPPAGHVQIVARTWHPDDLAGAAIAVGALDEGEAKEFAAAASAEGVPVNIVDWPQASTFSFGTIVNRSPVVVGISTSGAAPVLGQAIRTKIEALLHPALAAWGVAAHGLRATLSAMTPMGPARREAWRRFADRALAARTPPRDMDLEDCGRHDPPRGGSVALVGAGPGDPELLTVKALRALQSADVILYDRLVSHEILELARREARRMLVGKAGHGPSCRQEDICELMVKLARQGRRVVRLKGGDPMVFGRAAEEIEACRRAAIPVEVVPGITAALGAAAELGIPLTERGVSGRVTLVTGHARDGKVRDHDWANLANSDATTAFYMGASVFPIVLRRLLEAGLDPDTPSVVVAAATTPRSMHVACPARDLAEAIQQVDPSEPCLIIVGQTTRALAAQSPPNIQGLLSS